MRWWRSRLYLYMPLLKCCCDTLSMARSLWNLWGRSTGSVTLWSWCCRCSVRQLGLHLKPCSAGLDRILYAPFRKAPGLG